MISTSNSKRVQAMTMMTGGTGSEIIKNGVRLGGSRLQALTAYGFAGMRKKKSPWSLQVAAGYKLVKQVETIKSEATVVDPRTPGTRKERRRLDASCSPANPKTVDKKEKHPCPLKCQYRRSLYSCQ